MQMSTVPSGHKWIEQSKHCLKENDQQWNEIDDEVEHCADAESGAGIILNLHLLLLWLLQF